MSLAETAAALAEFFPGRTADDADRAERRLERFGRVAFGGLGIVIAIAVIGILYAIIRNSILAGDQPLVGIVLALFVVFAALALAWVVMNEDLKEKRKKRAVAPETFDRSLEKPDTNKLLNQPPAAVFNSVVDETTDLLPADHLERDRDN